MKTTTPKEVNRLLGAKAEQLCAELLPNGKRNLNSWQVGSVSGECGKSMSVDLKDGKGWNDFASEDYGSYIDLWMQLKGLEFFEAFEDCKKWLGVYELEPTKIYKQALQPQTAKPVKSKIQSYFGKRKIKPETLTKFNVQEDIVDGNAAIYFPYIQAGKLTHFKWMYFDKNTSKKRFKASYQTKQILFGWQALSNEQHDYIILTEGEIDCMSYYQLGYKALSVPIGGGDKGKQEWITNEYENLTQFETIYLSLDNDEVGQTANRAIAERLGVDRCKIITLPKKDINDCLQENITPEEIAACFKKAKHLSIKEVRNPSEFAEETLDWMYSERVPTGFETPWSNINEAWRPNFHELTLLNGINAHGKSEFANHFAIHCSLKLDMSSLICSMEIPHKKLLARLIKQSIAAVGLPDRALAEKALDIFEGKIFLGDFVKGVTPGKLLEVIAYTYRRFGTECIIIDSLMKCGIGEEDYSGQKAFVDKLCDLKNELPIHIFLVVHPRKGRDEEEIPNKMAVAGAGGITNLADNLFTIWRNKDREAAVKRQNERRLASDNWKLTLAQALVSKDPTDEQEKIAKDDLKISTTVGVIAHLQKDRENGNEQKFGLEYQKSQHVPSKRPNNTHYVRFGSAC